MKLQKAVLGGGCFWCLEASYKLIKGVTNVTSGYAGGKTKNPTYYDHGSGHAEVVQVEFDPQIISYKEILEIFWAIHDPTTLNRQGNDVGEQYRSIILYDGEQQKQIAEQSKSEVQKLWDNPVVTEIEPLEKFYEAEPEQQDFFERNPGLAYCQVIINPKLQKLRAKFADRIK